MKINKESSNQVKVSPFSTRNRADGPYGTFEILKDDQDNIHKN